MTETVRAAPSEYIPSTRFILFMSTLACLSEVNRMLSFFPVSDVTFALTLPLALGNTLVVSFVLQIVPVILFLSAFFHIVPDLWREEKGKRVDIHTATALLKACVVPGFIGLAFLVCSRPGQSDVVEGLLEVLQIVGLFILVAPFPIGYFFVLFSLQIIQLAMLKKGLLNIPSSDLARKYATGFKELVYLSILTTILSVAVRLASTVIDEPPTILIVGEEEEYEALNLAFNFLYRGILRWVSSGLVGIQALVVLMGVVLRVKAWIQGNGGTRSKTDDVEVGLTGAAREKGWW